MNDWIAIVEGDEASLKSIEKILDENQMHISSFRTGGEFLDFLKDGHPDLILMNITMPDMDGFDLYGKLRELERERKISKTPVIFLTEENDSSTEQKGLELGAADFIRKPLNAEVLLHRIENIVSNSERIRSLKEEASIDHLTGLLNKSNVTRKLEEICKTTEGVLLVIDLDSFKLVNDLYGHGTGDKVLILFAEILRKNMPPDTILGRIGGDEFIAFCKEMNDEVLLGELTEELNIQLSIGSEKIMGEDFDIPIGVSVGAVYLSGQENDYNELFRQADKALYFVKQNGKHGYFVYRENSSAEISYGDFYGKEMGRLTRILAERNEANCALWLGQDAFMNIYRFVLRYIHSYHGVAYKVLFTLRPLKAECKSSELAEIVEKFGSMVKKALRKSDIMMQNKSNQFFVLLPELTDQYIDNVIDRIMREWSRYGYTDVVEVLNELEMIDGRNQEEFERRYLSGKQPVQEKKKEE